ncbi:DNA mismatch repair protein MutS [Polaribacter irgensii 23-P]|uniref:DNA mismatch repair protein MutS n=1 Tax=Polaribacter irgensii 23-P TaxID=313594 RepID=A4C0U4_9FLAO|nr:DNA mismatch repair protein MutS [Polaribacter irgensii]EAR13037.1 DNA mismatch repair protein MutS [Polaribacter irgensii 23-P]
MYTNISKKTLQDLEFSTVLQHISERCISGLGKENVREIQPITGRKQLFTELHLVNEYLSSFQSENRVPNHGFDTITESVKRLKIENSFIETSEFLKIAAASLTVNEHLKFFKKLKLQFPTFFILSQKIEFTTYVDDEIKRIIDLSGEVKNNASSVLKQVRRDINNIRGKIGASFSSSLSKAIAAGYLDDIKETVVDNQRVLAVSAMHRRKIAGSLLGSSKSGNIVYIAPQATLAYAREFQNLEYEEKQEIIKILRTLAETIRPFTGLMEEYIAYLVRTDVVSAKAKYAVEMDAILPLITKEKRIFFKNAVHPILWRKNKEQKITTIPQSIELNEKQQIIVISGPNAGGKSITLKTIGLLQLMLQSGILIPVEERSQTYIFDSILTDIGDNQSIENHLSTYSYRLKNMHYFLKNCNENTLFLIDEFGTGTDPELGGALAEIFLEEFYEKKAFGIITTHYSNLKVLANELENVTNANMQFDERSLEPLFKLFVGQAGSSFTFEVAQKNGIPYSLINKAKKRVDTEKVRLDKTISKLQKERTILQRNSENLAKQKLKGQEHLESLQEKEDKIQLKLAGFQELYDNNQRMLSLGRKINEFLNKFFQNNNKKELNANFNKWVTDEKVKYAKKNPLTPKSKSQKQIAKVVEKQIQAVIKKVEKEVLEKVVAVREEKEIAEVKIAQEKATYVYEINDRVRIKDSNSIGTIDKIEKKSVTINYGVFTTKTAISNLELVEKVKK